jgi:formylmethanofuran dehydrogenase subunit E
VTQDLEALLHKSSISHTHLCPRQILGVRIGLAGLKGLGFSEPPAKKQLLVISETDGCFVDGVIAATNCTVGHRTLRVEDYGKVAATFVHIQTGCAIRIVPRLNVRERAFTFVQGEARHYFAQLRAYQIMPDEELLSLQEVALHIPVEEIRSKPGVRVNCCACGEEVINGREVLRGGEVFCRPCVVGRYYQPALFSQAASPSSLLCKAGR